MYQYLYKTRFIHFFITGVTGVILNLLTTFLTTEFIFGRDNYFYGYLCGLIINLIYNFTLHTIITFQTHKYHTLRFAGFVTYSLLLSALQAFLVKTIVDIVGVDLYLIVITGIIAIFSILTFILFKYGIFKEKN